MALGRKKIAVVFGEKYSTLIIQFVTSLVMARLLTPQDFGVYSLAAGVAALLSVFRDFGVGQYLVQEKELTREKMRAALGIMVVTSITMASLFIAISGPIASFYAEPELRALLVLLGVNFLFMPAGALAYGTWRRELQFGRIAIVNVGAATVGSLATVVLALAGQGSLSLALGLIASSATTTALCMVQAPPGLPHWPAFKGALPILRYASLSTLEALVRTLSERLAALLLGKSVTMTTLGIFERAQSLGGLFNQAVMQAVYAIAFPAVSHAVRIGREVGKPYVRAVTMISALGFAFYAWVAIFAEPIVLILLGQQWLDAADLLGLVCLRNALALPAAMSGGLIVGHGRIGTMTRLTTATHALNILSIVLAMPFGIRAILWASCLAAALGTGLTISVTRQYHSGRAMMMELIRSAAAMVLPALAALQISTMLDNDWLAIIVGSIAALTIWLLTLFALKHPLSAELLVGARAAREQLFRKAS